jgi:RimJ/RimL family protein N-acetyltransferase
VTPAEDRLHLRGERVLLRPFRPDELDLIRPAVGFQPKRGWRDRQRRKIRSSGRLHRGFLSLAIEADARLVGSIDARTEPKAMLPPGVFELGITLYETSDQGHGLGSEAVELLTAYLFRAGGAHRVQASTAITNGAMQRVLEKLGFEREGVMRDFIDGESYALYGLTRADFGRE